MRTPHHLLLHLFGTGVLVCLLGCLTHHAAAQLLPPPVIDTLVARTFEVSLGPTGGLLAPCVSNDPCHSQLTAIFKDDSTRPGLEFLFLPDGLWFGNVVEDGNLRVAARAGMHFESSDFTPGPLPVDPTAPWEERISRQFNRVYRMSQQRVRQFLEARDQGADLTGFADVLEWPAFRAGYGPLAPFVDADGDGRYNPLGSDYPDVLGEEMAWWVVNDAGPYRATRGATPLRIELHVTAFVADESDTAELPRGQLHFRVRCVNRSAGDYPQLRGGLFINPTAIFPGLSAVGTDTLRQHIYALPSGLQTVLNRRRDSLVTFAVAALPLSLAGRNRMSNSQFFTHNGSGFTSPPSWLSLTASQIWNPLNGRWTDGSPLVDDRQYNGDGYPDSLETEALPTRFQFPDPPRVDADTGAAYWGPPIDPNHHGVSKNWSAFMGFGEFALPRGGELTFDLAYVWASALTENYRLNPRMVRYFDELNRLNEQVERVRSRYPASYAGFRRPTSRRPAGGLAAVEAIPNPATDRLTLRHLPAGAWRARFCDVQGRTLLVRQGDAGPEATLELGNLPAGVYLLEVVGADALPIWLRVLVN